MLIGNALLRMLTNLTVHYLRLIAQKKFTPFNLSLHPLRHYQIILERAQKMDNCCETNVLTI